MTASENRPRRPRHRPPRQPVRRSRAAPPKWDVPLTFPDLPIAEHRDEIAAALASHQVVVLAGETGSGKTTQLPKMLLALGYGDSGLIGHTQPRRIAARAVAERIGDEIGVDGAVGYQVRFTDTSTPDTRIKVMTDGVLLNEINHDRDLSSYAAIIIDEAHERSLNIDFLLGYLRGLLARRPDLKLIITSATIDPARFAEHFGGAPMIEVSGRTYPVEIRYRPLDDEDEITGITSAVDDLPDDGDILVFLSGEREIRDAADALSAKNRRGTEILPLFGRLSAAEQHRVFAPSGNRRIILATNVAETSITVPGIRYVIDPGTARISRYSKRAKVQRLPIEPISQASAAQRAGRCGRVADGICIRLYSQSDFEARPEFTDPEIIRTNLASVLLAMLNLRLGAVERFPFIDPPDAGQIRDAHALLSELGAIEDGQRGGPRLTRIGRRMAHFPLDPRIARMIIEAEGNGALEEVIVLAAGLSIPDVRERPLEFEEAARAAHARFADKSSDFAALWNLWTYIREQQEALSSSKFRTMCRKEFLNYLRIREWQDLVAQLQRIAKESGMTRNSAAAGWDAIHRSILAGMLSQIGLYDSAKRDYLGARGTRFAVSPGSGLFKASPRWVMAAELVETTRLWARLAARIEPEWIEPLAGHLVAKSYSEPHWEQKRAAAVALERVSLYGLPLVVDRKVDFARIDPVASRELFIRHALVERDWRTHHGFLAKNATLLAEVGELEERIRRRDLVLDDEMLYLFYDQRIPSTIVSGAHFDRWWRTERHKTPSLLDLTPEIVKAGINGNIEEQFPTRWSSGGLDLSLAYLFEPGHELDGVSIDIPLADLGRADGPDLMMAVPGQQTALVTELVRSLPKPIRKQIGPAPNVAEEMLTGPGTGGEIRSRICEHLLRTKGVRVAVTDFNIDSLPAYLRPTIRVLAPDGSVIATGKDVAALVSEVGPALQTTVTRASAAMERDDVSGWDIGVLPESVTTRTGKQSMTGYPALTVEGDRVALRVFAGADQARREMRSGVAELLARELNPAKGIVGRLDGRTKLALGYAPGGDVGALLNDITRAAIDVIVDSRPPPRDETSFEELRALAKTSVPQLFGPAVHQVAELLPLAFELTRDTREVPATDRLRPAVTDIAAQVDRLVAPAFVRTHGLARMPDLLRYLKAARWRLDRLRTDIAKDSIRMAEIHQVERIIDEASAWARPDAVANARWQLEELRVSVFAQHLRGPKVSAQRIAKSLEAG